MSKKHYLTNRILLEEIMRCKETGKLSDLAVSYFSLIADKLTKLKYKNPEDREDCVQGGICDAIAYWRGFNAEKSTNAFSYFTMIILNGMAKTWNKLHPISTTREISISEENGIFNI